MSTEQVDYDILYDKGFEEKDTTVEQLEEDSTDEVVEEDVQEVEETTETDEESQDATEQTQDTDDEETTTDKELYELDYKGEKIKASKDELISLAQKGFDYTSKTQDLAKKREILELLGDMKTEDVKALVDAKGGDKEALSFIAKQAGIDIYDLTEEATYKPQVEQRNYGLDDAVNNIKADTEHGQIIDRWIDSLPSSTHKEFANDPQLLADLHTETKNGIAQKVIPEVLKKMAMGYATSFKEAYLSSRAEVVGPQANETKQGSTASRETIKKASVPKMNTSKHTNDHKDVWEDNELYAKMQKMRRGY